LKETDAQPIQFFILFSEPERKLLLAEKGGGEIGTDKSCVVTAAQNFHFIGTMNPGGDYGKKEVCILGIIVVHSLVQTHKEIVNKCTTQCVDLEAKQNMVSHMNSRRINVTCWAITCGLEDDDDVCDPSFVQKRSLQYIM
jgi:hypothetical protein